MKKKGVIGKRILEIDDSNEISLLIDNIKSNRIRKNTGVQVVGLKLKEGQDFLN